ncbi:hypothetical protein GWN26_07965 [Candidatus Saccharibacteria bacterium]|nr:hypothetical protein [Candidatus Saccharibacteria bacterium]NIV03833.1 hypothetical protein [Calditrichia bacterium]NIV99078.1 hypothetical protein [Candidatus Saccharibacteria bacterium]NIW79352.1 hypothetical protein [Calditrichia bacterium]
MLHSKHDQLEIKALGKIAGIDKITINKQWLESDKVTFFDSIFYGNLLVQLTRFIIFLFLSVFLFIALYFLADGIINLRKRRLERIRQKKIQQVFANHSLKSVGDNDKKEFFKRSYIMDGYKFLKKLQSHLEDERSLALEIKRSELTAKVDNLTLGLRVGTWTDDPLEKWMTTVVIPQLISKGVVSLNDNNVVHVDSNFKEDLELLLKYLKRE